MTRCRLLIAMAIVAVAAGGLRVPAQEPVPPLVALLASVPAASGSAESAGSTAGSHWATVRFVDFDALFASEGLSLVRALGSVDLLRTAVPLGPILGRVAAGPEALSSVFVSAGQMKEVVGFEWLLHVDQSLEFGDPPNPGLLLAGAFQPEAVSAALGRRGFAQTEVGTVPVWHRFADHALSIPDREIADPFGGHLGVAARIAVQPHLLANARSWGLIEAMISSGLGERTSLADDPAYRALAETISDAEGLLLQALFFPGDAFRLAAGASQVSRAAADASDALPPVSLAVLADRQEGEDQVHLIGVAVSDVATAHAAAHVLVHRLASFALPGTPDDPLVRGADATVRVHSVLSTQGGAIAVVEARVPLSKPRIDPETGIYAVRGTLFRSWIQAIQRREFSPLVWTPPEDEI